MWWIVGVVVLVVLIATYLTWMAGRVDRLHARAVASADTLDASLVRRAIVATELADGLGRPDLRAAARSALEAAPEDREGAENALTKVLRDLSGPLDAPEMAEIIVTSRRVSLTRQIHNDLVRDALSLRRRRLVRLMGFTRKHAVPTYFDVEDPQL